MQKKLIVSPSPFLRNTKVSTRSIMLDVIIALLPTALAAVWFFGAPALSVMLTCVLGCVISEWAYQKLTHQPITIGDLSAVVTGLLLAFNMPASAPWWMGLIGSVIAIVLVKQMFGGIGQNFMNPALAARTILMLSWTVLMAANVLPQAGQIFGIDASQKAALTTDSAIVETVATEATASTETTEATTEATAAATGTTATTDTTATADTAEAATVTTEATTEATAAAVTTEATTEATAAATGTTATTDTTATADTAAATAVTTEATTEATAAATGTAATTDTIATADTAAAAAVTTEATTEATAAATGTTATTNTTATADTAEAAAVTTEATTEATAAATGTTATTDTTATADTAATTAVTTEATAEATTEATAAATTGESTTSATPAVETVASATATTVEATSVATPLSSSVQPGDYTLWDLFSGNIPGMLGETCKLTLLLGGLYLIFRRVIDWRIPLSFIVTAFILFWIQTGVIYSPESGSQNALYQLLSGGLFLGAFFMATDYVTSPISKWGRVIMGVGCAVVLFVIRFYNAGYPEGCSFAILFMNVLTPLIDRFTVRKPFGYTKPLKAEGKGAAKA